MMTGEGTRPPHMDSFAANQARREAKNNDGNILVWRLCPEDSPNGVWLGLLHLTDVLREVAHIADRFNDGDDDNGVTINVVQMPVEDYLALPPFKGF